MKKLLTYVLTVVLTLPCLTACSNGVSNGDRFYNGKVLKEFQIMDFPKPQGTEDVYAPTNSQLYFNRTAEGFEEYAEQLYTYLVEKDFAYFGYRGDEIGTFFGGAPTYEFYLSSELSEHQYLVDRNGREFDNCYVFVFSNELSGNSLIHECAIELIYRPEDEEYNTHLFIYYDKNVFTGYRLMTNHTPEHEHTGEWVAYNQSEHYYRYTCGCTLPDRIEEHENRDGDLFCDVCGFNMSEIPTPTNYFLRNQAGCAWLNEITAEDIAEVKIIREAVGVALGNLKNISSSTDEAVIARIFEEYYWLDTWPISKAEGQIGGGRAVTVKFLLQDGTEKELYINNGNYRDTDDNYFALLYTPKFEESDNATKTYGFITYIGTGTVYDKENNLVCEIPTSELELVKSDGNVDAVVTGYYYTVETEFGTLWFDYSNDLFYRIFGEGEYTYREYYRLVGKNLDEWIAECSTH